MIEPIVKNPISDFDRVTNKLWEKNVILNLGKNRGAIQKEALELWTAKYKNDQEKMGLQCFLAGKHCTSPYTSSEVYGLPEESEGFQNVYPNPISHISWPLQHLARDELQACGPQEAHIRS